MTLLERLPELAADYTTEAMVGTAGDRFAQRSGYTRRVYIEGGMEDGEFLIRADTDLDTTFRAWGTDWQEWTMVHSCNVLIEEVG